MTDMMNMAINDMELDNVTGGATRTVKNNSLNYANVREGAGLKSKVITKINNGTKVKTTGNKIKKDGYVWYEITLENGSDNAWIAGSLIGYKLNARFTKNEIENRYENIREIRFHQREADLFFVLCRVKRRKKVEEILRAGQRIFTN